MESEVEAFLAKKDLPDIVLVRKVYATKAERKWKLRSMEYDEDQARLNAREAELREQDYEGFLQELEGDKEMRANINLYKAESVASAAPRTTAASTKSIKKSIATSRNKVSTARGGVQVKKSSGVATARDKKGDKMDGEDHDGDDGDDGEWEDMDDDEAGLDDDEEAIRLDELLDEMTLSLGNASAVNVSQVPGSEDVLLLSPQDAGTIAPVVLPTSGFDVADFNLSSVKFK